MKIKVSHFLILALALSSVLTMGVTVHAKKPLYCEKTWLFTSATTVGGPISGGIDGYFVGDVKDEKIVGQSIHQWGGWWIYEDATKTRLLLEGTARLIITPKNGKFTVGGPITWVDEGYDGGRYADLLGRKWWAVGDLIFDGTGQPIGGIDSARASARPVGRRTFKAYDGTNNLFNLAYEVLGWKVHRALVNAKLEPFLGFLHSVQHGKPSLVCDFQELYRCLIDDFLIQFCQNLKSKDFVVKTEDLTRKKKGKREYLTNRLTREMMKQLNQFFESYVKIPRMKIGKKQTVETLVNEDALLFAKFLRERIDERKTWTPRIVAKEE